MPERRPRDTTPDLFAAGAAKAPPPAAQKPAPKAETKWTDPPSRYLLPKDLSSALSRLDDSEVDTLLAAVHDEAKRRSRPSPANKPAEKLLGADKRAEPVQRDGSRARPSRSRAGRASGGDGEPSLTLSKTNAVRAAFMAGVKPATIARQFGISQSTVRQVLAAETKRKF